MDTNAVTAVAVQCTQQTAPSSQVNSHSHAAPQRCHAVPQRRVCPQHGQQPACSAMSTLSRTQAPQLLCFERLCLVSPTAFCHCFCPLHNATAILINLEESGLQFDTNALGAVGVFYTQATTRSFPMMSHQTLAASQRCKAVPRWSGCSLQGVPLLMP